jgi:hypothetical protein
MKTILLLLVMAVAVTTGFAQDSTQKKAPQYFIVLYTIGDNWDSNKQAYEQTYFKEHSAHLARLRKEKRIDIGGRYSDTGLLLLKAINQAEAEELVTKDIAIQNKLFKAAIFPFSPFYKGCVE